MSLTLCIEEVVESLDPQDVENIRSTAKNLIDEGMSVAEANERAVEIVLNQAVKERAELIEQFGESGVELPPEGDALLSATSERAANLAKLESAFELANSRTFANNRELKEALQTRLLNALKRKTKFSDGIKDLSTRRHNDPVSKEVVQHLTNLALTDARYALKTNENAIGWYDRKVRAAIAVLETIHPELATDPNAAMTFKWILAVTSNGLKVDKNFEIAERVYNQYKADGKMPSEVEGTGNAGDAINKSLKLYEPLKAELGPDLLRRFMVTEFKAKEITSALQLEVTGEYSDATVMGAAILGPKIGNGFYSNLNGIFDKLTIDRWLMRTWGRWTGSLLEDRPEAVAEKSKALDELIEKFSSSKYAKAKAAFEEVLKRDMTAGDAASVAKAITKASVDKDARVVMNRTGLGEEIRKMGNGLTKDIDGQKEAPRDPDREVIREVLSNALEEMRVDYPSMTMADLQALLWYPEKRLYDASKSTADANAESYEDEDAPDYENAAIKLARSKGIDDERINAARRRASGVRPGDGLLDAEGGQGGSGALSGPERKAFVRSRIFNRVRAKLREKRAEARGSSELAETNLPGNYRRIAKRPTRTLGRITEQVWSPEKTPKNQFEVAGAPMPQFLELKNTPEAAKYFKKQIGLAKRSSSLGAMVDVYPSYEIEGIRLFVTENGRAGFAIKPDGDLVSVFNHRKNNVKGVVPSILSLAVEQGAKKLDAFDTALPRLYSEYGFKAVSRVPFADEYAPDNWPYEELKDFNEGRPDVVYMVFDPDNYAGYEAGDGRLVDSMDEAVDIQTRALSEMPLFSPGGQMSNRPMQVAVRANEKAVLRKLGDRTSPGSNNAETVLTSPSRGAVSVEGTHYSTVVRSQLSSESYGTGKKGAERGRLARPTADPRVRNRIFFYVDTGDGITPESGVGGKAHTARLDNVYDAEQDVLGLFEQVRGMHRDRRDQFNEFEKLVYDSGFDGYYNPKAMTTQGVVVLLGDRTVDVSPGVSGEVPYEEPDISKRIEAFADSNLPGGSVTASRWIDLIRDTEFDTEDLREALSRVRPSDRIYRADLPHLEDGQRRIRESDLLLSPEGKDTVESFNKWKGGADVPVIEAHDINSHYFVEGQPVVLRVYHGTTKSFEVFDAEMHGEVRGFLGRMNYFTSSEYDASQNYAGGGPDLDSKIQNQTEEFVENFMDQIYAGYGEELVDVAKDYPGEMSKFSAQQILDGDPNAITALAEAVAYNGLHGGEYKLMELFVRTERPFVVSQDVDYRSDLFQYENAREKAIETVAESYGITPLDVMEDIDRYDDEVYDELDQLIGDRMEDVQEKLENVASEMSVPLDEVLRVVREIEFSTEEFLNALNTDGFYAVDPVTGADMVRGEFANRVLRELGYDSIIIQNAERVFRGMDMDASTHVHIFNDHRGNIKSATDNRGTYDVDQQNIYLSPGADPLRAGKSHDGKVYTHAKYAGRLPGFKAAKDALPEGFTFNGVRYNSETGEFQFMALKDWDTTDSPVIGKTVTVQKDGSRRIGRSGNRVTDKQKWRPRPGDNVALSPNAEAAPAFETPTPPDKWHKQLYERLRLGFVDRYDTLNKIQQRIEEHNGRLPVQERLDLALVQFPGMARAELDDLETDFTEPLMEMVRESGMEIEEIAKYLHARHAAEANDVLKRRNPKMKNNEALSGMTDQEASKILRDNVNNLAVRRIGEFIDRANRDRIQYLVDNQMLSRQEADSWLNNWRHYVPLYREEIGDGGYMPGLGGKGFDNMARMSKLRAGSSKPVDYKNMFAHMVAQHETFVVRKNKNVVGQKLWRMVNSNPNSDIWTTDPEEMPKTKTLKADGTVSYRPNLQDPNVLSVKFDGENRYIYFKPDNPYAVQMVSALKNMEQQKIGFIAKAGLTLNRYLSMINTQLSPEFVISNMMRDLQTAALNITDTEARDLSKTMLKGVPSAMAGIKSALRDDGSHEMAPWFDRFRRLGGMTGWMQSYESVGSRMRELEMRMKVESNPTLKTVQSMFKTITDYNTIVENAVRLSVFKASVEAGINENEAAKIAKELTVNFNRKGDSTTAANSLYLFFNASVQGSARIVRAVADPRNARLRKMLGGIIVASAVMDIINRMVGDDEDDPINSYDAILKREGERNIIFMDIFGITEDGYFKIPAPWGYNALMVAGQEIGAAVSAGMGIKDDYNVGNRGMRVLMSTLNAFNPIQSATILESLSPTAADPLVQIYSNTAWHGGPVFPDYDKNAPDYLKYYSTVREPSKWVAAKLNALTLDESTGKGAIDISPESLDLWYDFITGSAGRVAADTVGFVTKATGGEDMELKEIPMLRKLYGNMSDGDVKTIGYDHMYEVLDLDKAIRRDKVEYPERVEAMKEAGADKLKVLSAAKMTKKKLSVLRKKIKVAERAGDQELVDSLKEQQVTVLRNFERVYQRHVYK